MCPADVSRDDVKDPVQAGLKQQAAERGEKTAENIRYGQAISESGMGGMTGTAEGVGTKGLSSCLAFLVEFSDGLESRYGVRISTRRGIARAEGWWRGSRSRRADKPRL